MKHIVMNQQMQGTLPLKMAISEKELIARIEAKSRPYDWRLSDRTKTIGLAGVKVAKQALQVAKSYPTDYKRAA